MIKNKLKILFIITVLLNTPLSAEIYQYIDEKGKTHFVNKLENVPSHYEIKKKKLPQISKITSRTPEVLKNTNSKKKYGKNNVTILVTEYCPWCKKLENFLKDNRIKYTKLNVEKDKKGMKQYQELGAGGVPITLIDKEIIKGFNEIKLRESLNLN